MTSASGCQNPDFAELVAARKSCRICVDRKPGKISAGASFDFDPDVVSYWSQWLGHSRPQILVVGQDFGDVVYFKEFRGADDPKNKTNENLYKLLNHIGLAPSKPPRPDRNTRVFLTNSVLCLKEPPMNSQLSAPWIRACAINHLQPLGQKLLPPIVVAMGGPAWQAVQYALEVRGAPEKISAAAGGVWGTKTGISVFAVGHCSGLGIVNRSWETQLTDWSRIGDELTRLKQLTG